MKLYLIRHGETAWNAQKLLQGSVDIPLNENGLAQAEKSRKALEGIHFDRVFSSPLARAHKTAEIVCTGRDLEIVCDDRLRERNYGEFEGVYKPDTDYVNAWSITQNKHYEKAENIKDFLYRTGSFFAEMEALYPNESILAAAHAGVLKAAELYFHGPMDDAELASYVPKNAGYVLYDTEALGRKKPTTIYVVRHGQTDWNIRGIMQGCTDIPLNDTGRAQAAETREVLKDLPIDCVISSPLCRALETAKIITEGRDLPLHTDKRLMERGFGSYEGRTVAETPQGPNWILGQPSVIADGESLEATLDRVRACLDGVIAAHAGQNVLLVTHGGTARCIEQYFRGPDQELLNKYRLHNAEIRTYRV